MLVRILDLCEVLEGTELHGWVRKFLLGLALNRRTTHTLCFGTAHRCRMKLCIPINVASLVFVVVCCFTCAKLYISEDARAWFQFLWLLLVDYVVLLLGLLISWWIFLIFIIFVMSCDVVLVAVKDDNLIIFNYTCFMFDVTGSLMQKFYLLKIYSQRLAALLFVFWLLLWQWLNPNVNVAILFLFERAWVMAQPVPL